MSSVLYLIPVIFVLALLIPIAWTVGGTYLRFRSPRPVTCPEESQPATIRLDARFAAAMTVLGNPRARLRDCSRWPGRAACAQQCLQQVG